MNLAVAQGQDRTASRLSGPTCRCRSHPARATARDAALSGLTRPGFFWRDILRGEPRQRWERSPPARDRLSGATRGRGAGPAAGPEGETPLA